MLSTVWQAFLVSLIPLSMAVLATTVYLHRSATHGALALRPLALEPFKFLTWITTGLKPWEWGAVHRKHHRFTDVEGDPHSPYLEGFWNIQFWDVLYYVREARNPETVREYGADLLLARTWIDRNVYSHGLAGVMLGVVALCAIFGVKIGLLAAAIHAFLYVFVLSSSVNGLCHHKHSTGYQLYKRRDVVRIFNDLIVAFFTFGEGLHHNHHYHPSLARFCHRWWELPFDWGFIAIFVLEKLHLAINVKRRLPSQPFTV